MGDSVPHGSVSLAFTSTVSLDPQHRAVRLAERRRPGRREGSNWAESCPFGYSFFGPVLDLLTVGDPTCKGHCHPHKLSFPVITLPWRSRPIIPREPSWRPAWEEVHAREQQTCLLSPALPLTCSGTSRALSSGSLAL